MVVAHFRWQPRGVYADDKHSEPEAWEGHREVAADAPGLLARRQAEWPCQFGDFHSLPTIADLRDLRTLRPIGDVFVVPHQRGEAQGASA